MLLQSEISDKFPLSLLEPQQAVELIAAVHMQSPRKMQIKIKWDDASDRNREKLLTPTL
jgi:hypothetical protein